MVGGGPGYQPDFQPGFQPGLQQGIGGPSYGMAGGPAYGMGGHTYGGGGVCGGGEYPNEPAEDPTCYALLACLCCCWCIGCFAVFKAHEVSAANAVGDYQLAHRKRKEAMLWIYATFAIGLIVYIINTINTML